MTPTDEMCRNPDAEPVKSKRKRFGGLIVRRERWALSFKGRLLLLLLMVVIVVVVLRFSHPFLVKSEPAGGSFLIVEGWIPAYAIRASKELFYQGNYQKIVFCGPPVADDSGDITTATFADWGAARLQKAGFPEELMVRVPCQRVEKDRTYSSAQAVHAWLEKQGTPVVSVDVVTFDAHGRRSHMLFRKALGPHTKVGIISVPSRSYDPKRWWASSAGVREVLGEGIAYLYALIFVWSK